MSLNYNNHTINFKCTSDEDFARHQDDMAQFLKIHSTMLLEQTQACVQHR